MGIGLLHRSATGSLAVFSYFAFFVLGISAGSGASLRNQVDAAVAKVKPALVRIHVVSRDFRDGSEFKEQGVGSGAIITEDGFLVTNHHVAGHAKRLMCTLSSREEIEAELVGTDALTDIAVLKLKPSQPRKFPFAKFGDSSRMQVGDSVLAMGSPMALSQSITLGILSNVEMVMPRRFGPGAGLELDGENVGALVRWFAHDAAIYGGNSGGPLVNLRGEIIGINEISFGLSGAIPGNQARRVAEELMARGKIKRSWIGVDVQPLFKSATNDIGVVISGVVADSPGSRAGLRAGDILLKVGGKPVQVRFDEQMPEFMGLVTSLPIGQKVPFQVRRQGNEQMFTLIPVERGDMFLEQEELKEWGMTARDISFLTAKEMKRTNQNGVLITTVRAGGPATEAKPALSPGDVLIEVDGTAVDRVDELQRFTKQLRETNSEPVNVVAMFEREARRYLTVVRVGTVELTDPGLEVAKAWLPVEVQVISREVARAMNRPDLQGFYITQVYPRTTAEKAGLRPGDFILSVDKEKLTASRLEHEEELAALIRQYDIGTKVDLKVLRGKTEVTVPVELMRSPKLKREMKKYRNDDFEFTARDISFFDIAQERWQPDQEGALIEEVKSGGWADVASLMPGDLLVEIDGKPIRDAAAVRTEMARVANEKKPFVVMKVLRGIHSSYLEFEPSWEK